MFATILQLQQANQEEKEDLFEFFEGIYGPHFVELLKRSLKKTIPIKYGNILPSVSGNILPSVSGNIATDITIYGITNLSNCLLINVILFGKTFENHFKDSQNDFQVIYSYFIGYESITISNPKEFSGNKFYDCKDIMIDMPLEVNSFCVHFHFENCEKVTIYCNMSTERLSITKINSNVNLIGFIGTNEIL
jgi:hypothetical protein